MKDLWLSSQMEVNFDVIESCQMADNFKIDLPV